MMLLNFRVSPGGSALTPAGRFHLGLLTSLQHRSPGSARVPLRADVPRPLRRGRPCRNGWQRAHVPSLGSLLAPVCDTPPERASRAPAPIALLTRQMPGRA